MELVVVGVGVASSESSLPGSPRSPRWALTQSPSVLALLLLFIRIRFFAIPATAPRRAPLPVRFSRQEYWGAVGFPFLLQGIFPTQGSTHVCCIGRRVFNRWATLEACVLRYLCSNSPFL